MDLDGTIFWYLGGALTLFALVISFVGIRGKSNFPANGAQMWGITAFCALLVAGACVYGVANAAEEKEHREEEIAEEEAEAEEALAEEMPAEPTGDAESDGPKDGGQPPGSGDEAGRDNTELAVTSPEDGSLIFEPDGLDSDAGTVMIGYDNPSTVEHNIALEDNGGQLLAESEVITEGAVAIEADVVPGEYTYFCSVPGHREGGMEGVLTVAPGGANQGE